MLERWIYDDVGKEHNDIVGKKCANLGEMRRAGFPVPPGFALSLVAYERFMKETGASEEIERYLKTFVADPNDPASTSEYDDAAQSIREIVESKQMPRDMAATIRSYYDTLCKKAGRNDVPVATRSAGASSHPGQYETFLHVAGPEEVIRNIIKVWSSTFNARSLIARARWGLPLHSDPIGVAILQMVNAKAAGVMFTLNPVNGDTSKISIGGNWGLGESVVSGAVTNDQWLIDKITMEITERSISKKETEFQIRAGTGEVSYKSVELERQNTPCLADAEILQVVRLGKTLEEYFGAPQDVEWAIDGDLPLPHNVFLVQTRPETIWSKTDAEPVLKTQEVFGACDLCSFLQRH